MSINAVQIAKETMNAIKVGSYTNIAGQTINLTQLVNNAVNSSVLLNPNDPVYFKGDIKQNNKPNIYVTQETTLESAYRYSDSNVCVLNFASAYHPGGAFMAGALAQEESIARSSALYHTLCNHDEYYAENKLADSLYLDYTIYSPDVPVIKKDNGEWLDKPYLISVVTSPAPNYSACDSELRKEIKEVLDRRMVIILRTMILNGHRNIVLGAWGCGVFGNDPWVVSSLFKKNLELLPYFDNIEFAVYANKSSETYKAFETTFNRICK